MPVNVKVAQENYERYAFGRDHGHLDFVKKADKCDRFYRAEQWDETVRKKLEKQGKPVLTINQTLATVAAVQGELLNNRAEVTFKPGADGDEDVAHTLSRVHLNIIQNNSIYWTEQDVADDGFITSRGFYDCRVEFTENMLGKVKITQLDPRNVVIDSDASSYDPDEWKEVSITRWMSPQDIAIEYNEKDAKLLKDRAISDYMFGSDSVVESHHTFGGQNTQHNRSEHNSDPWIRRRIRVIERQYWKRRKRRFFVDLRTGESNPVPENWGEEQVASVANRFGVGLVERSYKQIRWTVSADTVVLHDDWSPYEHFTVVPYFPYFRRGQTIGLVENLISPQEQLNKTSSQELHIINTTANSGWKVKAGSLHNMTTEDLEARGAETGLVIEYKGEDPRQIEKIQPNQIPSGLDRVSTKSEGWIKSISGVSDSLRGFDREDVSGKAIEAKQTRGAMNLTKPFDNLKRTRHMLAKRILRLVQTYYTEPRILRITGERPGDRPEDVAINQPDAEGRITNDLTIGTYDVVMSSRLPQDTHDQFQFQQAMEMRRDLGVQLPDKILIEMSELENKQQILQEMNLGADSLQRQQEQESQQQQIDRAKAEAEALQKQADAALAQARAQKVQAETVELAGQSEEDAQAEAKRQHELRIKQMELESQERVKQQQLEWERQKFQEEQDFKEAQQEEENRLRRLEIRSRDNAQSQ